jgi:hypothetical protein
MRKFSIILLVFLSIKTYGQNIYQGQILSLVDSTPVPRFSIRVDNKSIIATDSSGYFSATTKKNRVRLSTIFGLHGFDTTLNNKDNIKLYAAKFYDSILATYDVQHGTIMLFCGVAFAPMAPMQRDKDFEKKYNVRYYIVGDFLPSSVAQMTSYNMVVADYLDRKYGKGWRLEIRHDVLGLMQKKAGSQRPVLRQRG